MDLVLLINVEVLINILPYSIFILVVQKYRLNLELWVLDSFKVMRKLVYLHMFTLANLQVMHQMHMLALADHNEKHLVMLIDKYIHVEEVLDGLCG